MIPSLDLLSLYAPNDQPCIKQVVTDVLRATTTPDQVVFVGGMATRLFLADRGQNVTARPLNDVDLAATGPRVFNGEVVQQDFLIHHFHPSDGRIVLAHRATALKVDVFPMSRPELYRDLGTPAKVGEHTMLLQRLPWRLAQTVWDLWVMPRYNKVDPKQLADGLALYAVATQAEREEAEAIWQLINSPEAPDLHSALQYAGSEAAQQNYGPNPWKVYQPYDCWQCSGHPLWPLAPMQEVLELLGYIEGK